MRLSPSRAAAPRGPQPIAASMVGGMITSTIHVLILVPVFFVLMKEWALRRRHVAAGTGGVMEVKGNPNTHRRAMARPVALAIEVLRYTLLTERE